MWKKTFQVSKISNCNYSSPSTSRAENLNDAYYEAETAGRESNCQLYAEKCPLSILDLISIYKK